MASNGLQTVAVTTDLSSVDLGDSVTVIVRIDGDPDRKVHGAKVQLVRNAAHRYTMTDLTDRKAHKHFDFEDAVITETRICSDRESTPGEHVVSLGIPADGLPSADGQVSWSIRAVIERHLGHDVSSQVPIQVLAGPERFASEATDEPRYVGDRCVEIDVSTRTLRAGETITGTVTLSPDRSITVTYIGVVFARTTSLEEGLKGHFLAPQMLQDQSLQLDPGDRRSVPFEVTLPTDAAPTVRGSLTTPHCHSAVAWEIGAHVTIGPSAEDAPPTDSYMFLGLNVYNTPELPAPNAQID